MRRPSTLVSVATVMLMSSWLCSFSGCGGGAEQTGADGKGPKQAGKGSDPDNPETAGKRKKFRPVQLDGGAAQAEGSSGSKSGGKGSVPDEKKIASVVTALQPFQVMLGNWHWTTFKKIGDAPKYGEDLQWIWDFKTDIRQPALTFHSDKSPYFHAGGLTYLPDSDKFRLTTESPDGDKRVFEGTWAEGGEPAETLEGKKTQRSYKLQLAQISPEDGEQWRVVMNQQNNDRYLLELSKKPAAGTQFGKLDTVASQRLGTSFAALDSDNPGVKCIISGGLGTMTATYKGKSYPMCCTGCIAAFNDDPERWLAKLAKAQSEMKKYE